MVKIFFKNNSKTRENRYDREEEKKFNLIF